MSRLVLIAAGLSVLGAMPLAAAPAAAPFPIAKDGTTNIADCAKADVRFRNECISKSRPVSGKQLYAEAAAQKAMADKKAAFEKFKADKAAKIAAVQKAAADKVAALKAAKAAAIPAAVAGAPKGFKISKDGTTNVADCGKARPDVRDQCLSRARPLTGAELAKFVKAREAEVAATAAKAPAKPTVKEAVKAAAAKAAAPVVAAAAAVKAAVTPSAAPVVGKGFKIAKDGTTDIADCGKANPNYRDECISRSRPVPGSVIYGAAKAKQ